MTAEEYCKMAHLGFLGIEPTEEQLALYKATPRYKGFATKTPSESQVEAVLIMAMLKTVDGTHDVAVYIPHERYTGPTIKALLDLGKKFIHRVPADEQYKLAKGIERKYFERLKIVVPTNWRACPERWVACYFHEKSPVPPWFTQDLLKP